MKYKLTPTTLNLGDLQQPPTPYFAQWSDKMRERERVECEPTHRSVSARASHGDIIIKS